MQYPLNKVLKVHEKKMKKATEGRGKQKKEQQLLKTCLKQMEFQSVFKCVHDATLPNVWGQLIPKERCSMCKGPLE